MWKTDFVISASHLFFYDRHKKILPTKVENLMDFFGWRIFFLNTSFVSYREKKKNNYGYIELPWGAGKDERLGL